MTRVHETIIAANLVLALIVEEWRLGLITSGTFNPFKNVKDELECLFLALSLQYNPKTAEREDETCRE